MPAPSSEYLARLVRETNYRIDTLEKVVRLLDLLLEIERHPLLNRVLVLKGGTAINLGFGKPKRLSVDLDFNYIGQLHRDAMLRDRPEVEEAICRIAQMQGYRVQASRQGHAGGKWFLNYQTADNTQDRIEIDLNFLHRLPLLDPVKRRLWSPSDQSIQVRMLAVEELYAGKVCAMLDRMAPRDLFDMSQMRDLAPHLVNSDLFKTIFVAMSGGLVHPVYTYVQRYEKGVDIADIENQLFPMLTIDKTLEPNVLFRQAWDVVKPLLDLTNSERMFVDELQRGVLKAELLFPNNPAYRERVSKNPMLVWKAQNAAQHVRRES